MFQRYSQTRPISHGIHYYSNEKGEYIHLRQEYLQLTKVVRHGFIVGISQSFIFGHVLRPIYDNQHRMVVVRLRDYMNIPVSPFDVPNFNFHQLLPPSLPPSFDRGNMPPLSPSNIRHGTQESDDEPRHSQPRLEHGESSIQGSRRNSPQNRDR